MKPIIPFARREQRAGIRPPTKRLVTSLFVGAVLAVTSLTGFAQNINDVPMSVKNNVPPNFMFMLDNSGSMINIVPTAPYDESVNYTPTSNCPQVVPTSAAITLAIATAGTSPTRGSRSYIRYGGNNYLHSTQTPSSVFGNGTFRCFSRTGIYRATLVTNAGGSLPSEYTGNYLNWYFGTHCSGSTSWTGNRKPIGSCTGEVRTRIEIAKSSARNIVNSSLPKPASAASPTQVRIGLSTYNGGNGGKLIVPIKNLSFTDTDDNDEFVGRNRFNTSIDNLALETYTPLAETLADIGRYLATGYVGNISPSGLTSSVNIDEFFRQGSSSARRSCLPYNGTQYCWNLNSTNVAARPPITAWCQRSYVFMLTDGRSTQDIAFSGNSYLRDYDRDCTGTNAANCERSGGNVVYDRKINRDYETGNDGSDYLDDVAKALFDTDLRPDLEDPNPGPLPNPRKPKNNAVTYVIGFADTQVLGDRLLQSAADQGGGKFVTAVDDTALTAALRNVVTAAFTEDAASAAVAVANADITVNNVSYAPSFNSGGWYGDLEAFALDSATGARTGTAVWSARDNLQARPHTDRKIVTFNGTSGVPFRQNFTGAPATLTPNLINFLRGDRSLEDTDGDGVGFRARQFVLGDIVNAEPVVVNYPSPVAGEGDIPIVFQAANDGMVHVFDGRVTGASTTQGQELWAYVPRAVQANLPLLADVAYEHRYFVDATPAAAQISGFGALTRLLVGGLGKGGGAYYALDISSYQAADEAAAASKVRWEFKPDIPSQLGYTFGSPLIVNTAAGWRVVVSSGYGNGTNGPNGNGDGVGRVWLLNPATGAVEGTIPTPVGTAAAPAGLAHLSRLANTAPDALVRYVYGGDLYGNVWRFDLDSLSATRIAELRDGSSIAGVPQPITAPVEVGPVSGSTTRYFIYAGTGQYLSDDDVPDAPTQNSVARQRQSMYGIIDDTSVVTPTLPVIRGNNQYSCPASSSNDFVCQSLTFNATLGEYEVTTRALTTEKRGWYVDFPDDDRVRHGRVTGKPVITTGGTLAFTVNIPALVECKPGGSSWFLRLSGQNGGAIAVTAGGTEYYSAAVFLGDALASRVVVVTTSDGKRGLVQLSNKDFRNPRIPETTTPGGAPAWRRIYWRQLK